MTLGTPSVVLEKLKSTMYQRMKVNEVVAMQINVLTVPMEPMLHILSKWTELLVPW